MPIVPKIYLASIFILITTIALSQSVVSEVLYTNGVSKTVNHIAVVDQGKPTCHLILDHSQNVPINLISAFQIGSDYYMIKEFDMGPVILKRTKEGTISIFQTTVEQYRESSVLAGREINKYTLYLYTNELKILTKENLKKDLVPYPDYVERIKKMSKRSVIRTTGILSGIILSAIGLGQMYQPDPVESSTKFSFSPNPPFVSGIALIFVSSAIGKNNKDTLESIIDDFNHAQANF